MVTKRETSELTRVEPAKPARFHSPFEEMERWIDETFWRPFSMLRPSLVGRMAGAEVVAPSVDIFEEGDNIIVKADLPGMNKNDIEITLVDDLMTISGEKKTEETTHKKNYYAHERTYGKFSRTIRLPMQVMSDQAKAKFENGILEVTVPKTEEAKRKEKKITIE